MSDSKVIGTGILLAEHKLEDKESGLTSLINLIDSFTIKPTGTAKDIPKDAASMTGPLVVGSFWRSLDQPPDADYELQFRTKLQDDSDWKPTLERRFRFQKSRQRLFFKIQDLRLKPITGTVWFEVRLREADTAGAEWVSQVFPLSIVLAAE